MNSWQATHHDYPSTSWWTVDEPNEDGPIARRIVDCGQDESLARRIAKLPEMEALVALAVAWQQSFVHGRDMTGEGYSTADEPAEVALYEAAEAAGKVKDVGNPERDALAWWDHWAPQIQCAWEAYIDKKRRLSSSSADISRCFGAYVELVCQADKASGGAVKQRDNQKETDS